VHRDFAPSSRDGILAQLSICADAARLRVAAPCRRPLAAER
jgi:hypothetical protein